MLQKGTAKANFKLLNSIIGEGAKAPQGNANTDSYLAQFAANDTEFKKDSFVFFNARHLSEGTVASGEYRSTTFSKDVLLKSLPLFNNLLVYFDHYISVEECKGFCYAGQWDNGNETTPAGINAIIALDLRKPKVMEIAQTANYPIKNPLSMSVTVEYEYEDSHDFAQLPQGQWWSYGMIAPDGKEITRNVTNIVKYYETSVVWEGADSNAKVYNETEMPFSEKIPTQENEYKDLSFEIDTRKSQGANIESFKKEETMKVETEQNSFEVEKQAFEAQIESFKNEVATLKNEITALKEERESLNLKVKAGELALKTELQTRILAEKQVDEFIANEQTIKSELESANKELDSFKSKFQEIEQYTTQKRESVIANYRKAKVDSQENESELQEIQTASLSQLESLNEKYVKDVFEQFGVQCNDCKSKNVSLRSSITNNDKEESKQKKDFFEVN